MDKLHFDRRLEWQVFFKFHVPYGNLTKTKNSIHRLATLPKGGHEIFSTYICEEKFILCNCVENIFPHMHWVFHEEKRCVKKRKSLSV